MKELIRFLTKYGELYSHASIYIIFLIASLLVSVILFGLLHSTGVMKLAFEEYIEQAEFGGAFAGFIVTLIFLINSYNQKTNVTKLIMKGNVLDSKHNPVKGAKVFIRGNDRTKETDTNGGFEIEVDDQKSWEVIASYEGSKAKLNTKETVKKKDIREPVKLLFKEEVVPPKPEVLRALQPEAEIPPLITPIKDIALPKDESNSTLKVQRILEGQAPDSASRVFDIVLANRSNVQIMLTKFEIHWRYHHGMLSAVDHGVALKPVANYIIEFPVDPDLDDQQEKIETIYPVIIIPPQNESGPSITTFRIQLHYYFSGRIDWHPCFDWNILFSLAIIDNGGNKVQLFSNSYWRQS